MVDIRYCTAGQNRDGLWYLACRDTNMGSLDRLRHHGFDQNISAPADRCYHLAAQHVQAQGGMFWKTNAPSEYTTVAGIPQRDSGAVCLNKPYDNCMG